MTESATTWKTVHLIFEDPSRSKPKSVYIREEVFAIELHSAINLDDTIEKLEQLLLEKYAEQFKGYTYLGIRKLMQIEPTLFQEPDLNMSGINGVFLSAVEYCVANRSIVTANAEDEKEMKVTLLA